MIEKRYTIKPQDDLFGVVDNYSADKVCVINGIRTEIEAKWLCKDMNTLNDKNEQLKFELVESKKAHSNCDKLWWKLHDEKEQLEKENEKLKEENKKLEQENEVSYKEIRRIIKEGVMPHQNKIQQLRRKNEQLKSICQDHRDHAIDFKADCIRLEKENEQLKRQREYLFDVIDEVLPHSGSTAVYNRMKKIGDVE